MTARADGTAQVVDVASGRALVVRLAAAGAVIERRLQPGRRAGADRERRRVGAGLGLRGRRLLARFAASRPSITAAFSPDGDADRDGRRRRDRADMECGTRQAAADVPRPGARSLSAAFSPDGRSIVTAGATDGTGSGTRRTPDERPRSSEDTTGRSGASLQPGRERSSSPPRRMGPRASGGTVTAQPRRCILHGHTRDGRRGRLQPGRKADRHRQRRWDGAGLGPGPGRPARDAGAGAAPSTTVAFSPTGSWSSMRRPAREDRAGLAARHGTQRSRTLAPRARSRHRVPFSPDGSSIVTASDDGTTRVWDAATGRQIAVLPSEASTPSTTPPSARTGSSLIVA